MLTQTINAYAFQQYADDPDIQLYFGMFNAASQQYLDWFNANSLAYYPGLTGSLLQWVAAGLYGQPYFNAVEASGTPAVGPLNTAALNTIPLNSYVAPTETFYAITDDIYQRSLTWNLYKGDGKRFCVRWLKRRIMRFILGVNGIDPEPWNNPEYVVGCESTYGVSVQFTENYLSAPTQLTPSTATTGGSLPPSTTYYFKIVAANGFGSTLPSSEQHIETGSGSTNKITVNWNAVAGASAIEIWFGTTAGGEASYFTAAGSATSFSFTTTSGATAGTLPTANTALAGQTCTVSLNQLVLSALTQLTPNILQTLQALFLAPGNPPAPQADWVLEKPLEYTYVVNINTTLTALVSPLNLSVVGATASESTGAATVSALGGSGTYTYAWVWLSGGTGITINSASANVTTFTASGLTAGETLTGVAQCTVTDTSTHDTATCAVNVSIERVSLPAATPSPTSITTYGASSNITSAQVQVEVTDGAGPYTFAWTWQSGGTDISIDSPSTSATTFTGIGLTVGQELTGTALCTVTDAYGQQTTCTVSVAITRATAVSATISPSSLESLSAATSQTTGSTTVTASGGIAPYIYAWGWHTGGPGISIVSPTAATTNFSASGMTQPTTRSGTAICTVTDSVGQQTQVTCSVEIICVSAVTASVSPSSQSIASTAATQTTSVSTVTASGGSGTYTYAWTWISGGSHLAINSPYSAATSFTGSSMSAGNAYSGTARCAITDGYGQQTTVSVSVEIVCEINPVTYTYTDQAATTNTIPSGSVQVAIESWAQGGTGGSGSTVIRSGVPFPYGGGGGGAGGYFRKTLAISPANWGETIAISSTENLAAVTVSSGTFSMTTLTANPGANGTAAVEAVPGDGGAGGTATNGDVNTTGNTGGNGGSNEPGIGATGTTGVNGGPYGAGGNGGNGSGSVGETGQPGAVILHYT